MDNMVLEKKQHLWEEFVEGRMQDQQDLEDLQMSIAVQQYERAKKKEKENLTLRRTWARQIDEKQRQGSQGRPGV